MLPANLCIADAPLYCTYKGEDFCSGSVHAGTLPCNVISAPPCIHRVNVNASMPLLACMADGSGAHAWTLASTAGPLTSVFSWRVWFDRHDHVG